MPGAGKSVLTSIVIKVVEEEAKVSSSPICVAYIYFRYTDHTTATVRDYLEVLVTQTVERHKAKCAPLFDDLYASHRVEKTQPTEDELLCLLQRFTELIPATFYFLDAIDEAPVAVQLEIIQKLSSLTAKLFITSRPLKALEGHLPNAHHFEFTAQDCDLELHINKEISRATGLRTIMQEADGKWQEKIVATVKQKCGGMFLHASLQLDALRECTSLHEVETVLKDFPPRIESVYRLTWDRILNQTPRKTLLAKNVIVWVMTATVPLTVEQLQNVAARCPESHKFEASRLVSPHMLLDVCHGLLVVEEHTNIVQLVHYSAKDTLDILILETYPFPHSLAAAFCMTLLTECYFQHSMIHTREGLEEALKVELMLPYAYGSWATHARRSLNDPSTANRLSDFVQGCHAFPALFHSNKWFDVLGPFHVAACFNLPVRFAGSDDVRDPNRITRHMGFTPLGLAALQAHETRVEELLSLPRVRANAVDKDGWSVLAWAAAHGRDDIIKLLLAHGKVKVNQADAIGWTALMRAAWRGHEDTVKLLLADPKIKVNHTDENGATALIIASGEGNVGTVNLLLDHPQVKVNLADNAGRSALISAIRGRSLWAAPQAGNRETVKLLLEHHQINVNQADKQGWTALQWATHEGQMEMAQCLVSHPQIKTSTTADALADALNRGHERMVRLFDELSRRPLGFGRI
ncbi:ankyrin repeat-containing domain protein [Coprinopsis sp. MPI-PUGE-AT-0042]|nr:ankyrin repeat-containing domain protein [Coprinopsis sp. MPI-PUGE-AT-0042]